ncbi:MAG: hypothetical protein AAFV90_13195 [Cyanobacteria bacterium J06634_5]
MNSEPLAARLENYTIKYPDEVLLVEVDIEGEADSILVFRGFSSSLMRPTAYDPEVPTLPESALIYKIDRLKGPYQPDAPQYIEQGVSLARFIAKLESLGL